MSVAAALQSYYANHIDPHVHVTDVKPLGDGWETDVFAYQLQSSTETRPLVLRVYAGGDSAEFRARNEHHVMTTLHTLSYPVPNVLHFEPDQSHLGGPFLIMERMPGSTLQSQLQQHPEPITLLCRLLFDLHQVDWRPFVGGASPWQNAAEAEGTFGLDWLSRQIDRYGFADQFRPLLDWLAERGERIEMKRAVVHGDFHPFNILVDDDGNPAVIDWGSTCVADPRIDVANALILAHVLAQPELAGQIVAGYEALVGEPLADLDYFLTLVLTLREAVMLIAMAHGAAAVGLRAGTDEHIRHHVGRAVAIHDHLSAMTGVALPALRQALAQFE